jgi:hypothetical protein
MSQKKPVYVKGGKGGRKRKEKREREKITSMNVQE